MMNRYGKKFVVYGLFVFLFFPFFSLPCLGKTYSIPEVNIDCTILQDSRVTWKEDRTFLFQGDYSFGYYDLPKTGYDWARDIVVGENDIPYAFNESKTTGTYWLENITDAHRVHFYYTAENEKRTFQYSYTLEGAVDIYEDYGQFYWKLQGKGWGSSVGSFLATLHFEKPIPQDEVMVWAHGPLNGVVSKIDDSTVRLEVTDVPAYSFVEIRLLVPTSYFQTTETLTGTIKEKAMEEEAVWVKEANEIRDRLEEEVAPELTKEEIEKQALEEAVRLKNRQRRNLIWRWFWDIFFYGISLFLLLYSLNTYQKLGKEHQYTKQFDYIREPPENIPPAEVGYVMCFDRLHPNTMQAVILDLIRRKYIRQEEGDGIDFPKNELVLIQEEEKGIGPLEEYERILLFEFLFRDEKYENHPKTTIKKLKKAFRTMPNTFYTVSERFKKSILTIVKEKEYVDYKSKEIGEIFSILCGVFLGFFVLIGLFLPKRYLIILPVLLFSVLIGHFAFPRRTKLGKKIFDQSQAFKRFLNDFTQLKNVEMDSLVIWEKYLVYSVILGVSRKVISALELKIQYLHPNQSNLLSSNQIRFYHQLTGMTLAINNNARNISKTVSASSSSYRFTSHRSSYSGGGGGFSGGGGHGGGGSGGGMG